MTPTFAILTGEYPPAVGGVSDYSAQVAHGLAAMAQRSAVHVFAPAHRTDSLAGDSVVLHGLPDRFGLSSLSMLDEQLDRLPRPRNILVQYVPHAFGCRAMNLPLCLWLLARSREDRVTVMFHEVAYPMARGQRLHHNVLGAVNRCMAGMLARASSGGMIVTIPAWEKLLRTLGARGRIEVSPVPSNVPIAVDSCAVKRARAAFSGGEQSLVGVFGSFGSLISEMLERILPRVVDGKTRVVLIGRGSNEFRAKLRCGDRAIATGSIDARATAEAIAACDIMLQPYPDGVSGRRSSTSAALALGVPVVTNAGALSEEFWRTSRAVALADSPEADSIVATTMQLLGDASRRQTMQRAAMELYDQRFALRHTIARVLAMVGAA